ncbi:L-2-hydroxyglutarate oxidase [Halobacillus shinanisalinarum]|uniref:L-2-hydroxyglutarate oxidase n=1 Tax=Halobacillus shinanisalinarum TaxID=2932258 RepID=A0ABY4H4P1_9BACI|nr:L-2-hydroxyglutarate oxidase [Halobacillus shinanisalinarum]UOQ95133.1 L-2-hydroxyglutarate oxidase [Halobacillus shinanisalinarum]
MYDYVIVGAGIVGLAVAYSIQKHRPKASIAIVDKEKQVATHQTGHNSGVIHSGIYYKPGSYKARFAKAGNESMIAFCEEHGIAYDQCGKVIVATREEQLPALQKLYERGQDNGLTVHWLEQEALLQREPYVKGAAAIEVPSTGIVDYKEVSETLALLTKEKGADLYLNAEVKRIDEQDVVTIETNQQTIRGKKMINCAGLHSDRIAELAGYHLDMQIVPFRGEYYQLKGESRHLVKDLIYPVPNPDFPFSGVHFTRMIDGSVEAGPNAVLGFKREGYTKKDWSITDLSQVLGSTGFWRLASSYMKEGMGEMKRSFSKKAFVRGLQELIPSLTEDDVEPAPAGVRAQAMRSDGTLVDDFYIIAGKRSFHVCNAPSPAATSALQIGEEVFRKMEEKNSYAI